MEVGGGGGCEVSLACGQNIFCFRYNFQRKKKIINYQKKVKRLKPSRVLESHEPSSQVNVTRQRMWTRAEPWPGSGLLSLCSLPLTREAGPSSPPHAQETRSGKPTNNPLWKVEKETDVLIK